MQKQQAKNNDGLLANFRYRKKWKQVTSVLSVFVAAGTIGALMLPAITLNQSACGLEEHSHSTECNSVTVEQVLLCDYESLGVHTHSSGCYDSEGNLTCNLADFVVHAHDSQCFDAVGALVCPLKEVSEHRHTDGCYQATEIVTDAGHAHIDSCYDWLSGETPTCGVEESADHTHNESCYSAVRGELLCTEAEREPTVEPGEPVLICEKPEVIVHTHADACYTYDTDGNRTACICQLPEVISHQHTDACFTEQEIVTLTCTLPEHTHTEDCSVTEDLTAEEQAQVDAVIAQIEALNTQEQVSDRLANFEEAGDMTGRDSYLADLMTQLDSVFAEYDALTEAQKATVTNAAKLVGLKTLLENITFPVMTEQEKTQVEALIAQIESLPEAETFELSIDSTTRQELTALVENLRQIYNSMSLTQQKAVTNEHKLAGIEAVLTPSCTCDTEDGKHSEECPLCVDFDKIITSLCSAESLEEMIARFTLVQNETDKFTASDVLAIEQQMEALYLALPEPTEIDADNYYFMMNAMLEIRGVLEMCICGASPEDHGFFCPLYWEYSTSYQSTSGVGTSKSRQMESSAFTTDGQENIVTSKWATSDGDTSFNLFIEAYAKGYTFTNVHTKPADIVLVVDQSTSMLYGTSDGFKLFPGTNETGTGGLTRAYMNTDEAKKHGEFGMYYLAYGLNNICFLTYQNGQWMYVDTGLTKSGTIHPNHSQLNGDYWNGVIDQVLPDWEAFKSKLQPMTETMWSRFEKHGIYATRFGTLYEALHEFVETLAATGVDHRIAIVGFGGPNQAGTELIVNGTGTQHNNVTNLLYQEALVDISENKTSVQNSVNALLPNASRTYHEYGVEMANGVFANNPIDLAERDRIVVFFSDGDHSGGSGNDTHSYEQAYTAKQTYGAQFYSIGLATAPPTLMNQLSSNYPDYDGSNTATPADDKYYLRANNSEELMNAFSSISSTVGGTAVELDETAYIQDVVTKYFVISDNPNSVRAYTILCTGFVDGVPLWSDEMVPVDPSNIIVSENTVKVTGFDYSANFVSEGGRTEGSTTETGDFYGRKLRIEIDIDPHEEFIGGNAVVTNERSSALYEGGGTPVEYLPLPDVDVRLLSQNVIAPDLHLYLGSELAKQLTLADLEQIAMATVNDVKLDLTKPDQDYGITWQDDYADITVVLLDKNGNELTNGFQDLRADQKYYIKLILDPIYEGIEVTESISNEASITIYYPELTFKDGTYYVGEPLPTQTEMSDRNWLQDETLWKSADGVSSNDVIMTSLDVPDLSLSYDTGCDDVTMPNHEVPVQVTIDSAGYVTYANAYATFKWQRCDPDCGKNIVTHNAAADSVDFYLHTFFTVQLPEAGSVGTTPYMFSGWAILAIACALMYSKSRKQRKGAR